MPRESWNQHGRPVQRYTGLKAERLRMANRKHRYGVDYLPYNEILKAQNSVCAICNGPFKGKMEPQLDHDHSSMLIRGLLCFNCNRGIGGLRDNPELLRKAITYLEQPDRGFGSVKRHRRAWFE